MGVSSGSIPTNANEGYVTVTEVDSSTPVEIAPSQSTRVAFVLFNESGVLYVLCGEGTVSNDNFTYRLTSHCTLENTWWKGRISVVKETGSSKVRSSVYLGEY